MEESIMDMMNGPVIEAENKAIENAKEVVELRHIDFFKSQPPFSLFPEDGYLKLNRCFTAVSKIHENTGGSSFRRDFAYEIEKSCSIPQYIIDDLVQEISKALRPFMYRNLDFG
jgi:hypothetical protein